ncbi:MAG: TolC family protein [Bacteroidota bacterium]
MKRLSLLCLMSLQLLWAQDRQIVHILADEGSQIQSLASLVQQELSALALGRLDISFGVGTLQEAPSGNADLLISIGPTVSQGLIQEGDYPTPVIIGTVLDPQLQGLPLTDEGTSGKTNLNYILNPFDVAKDLEYFRLMRPFQHLAILLDQELIELNEAFAQNLTSVGKEGETISLVGVESTDIDQLFAKLPDGVDAVYLLPLGRDFPASKRTPLFEKLSENELPTFSMFGGSWVEQGAMASRAPDQSGQIIARRIALNALAILEGADASEQPVATVKVGDDFVINLKAVEQSGIYPSWEAFGKARLLNIAQQTSSNTVNIRSVIDQALTQNLSYQIAELETQAGAQDVRLAVSELLPDLSLSTNFVAIDQARSEASFGSTQPYTWSASAELNQAILVEPLLANLRIQNLIQATRLASQDQTAMDVILEVTEAYFGILLTRNVVLLQNQNVNNTRINLNLAQNKESVGYSGVSEVYRWESQLAFNKIDLNDAQANYRSAQFRLNQLLNQPQSQSFALAETELGDSVLTLLDARIFSFLENPGQLIQLSDFLVAEGKRNLPELKQVALSLEAQERLLLSRQRAFYLPTLGLNASSGYNIYQGGFESDTEIPPQFAEVLPDPITSPTWTVAMGLSLPLYQGGSRQAQKQQAVVEVLRIKQQRTDLENQLELRIRSSLQQAGASFAEIGLSREAAEAAQKNLKIAQDGYREGIVPVAQLIDAQDAALQAELLANNAVYSFLIDFLTVERAIGFYYFLADPAEQAAFIERLDLFFTP